MTIWPKNCSGSFKNNCNKKKINQWCKCIPLYNTILDLVHNNKANLTPIVSESLEDIFQQIGSSINVLAITADFGRKTKRRTKHSSVQVTKSYPICDLLYFLFFFMLILLSLKTWQMRYDFVPIGMFDHQHYVNLIIS